MVHSRIEKPLFEKLNQNDLARLEPEILEHCIFILVRKWYLQVCRLVYVHCYTGLSTVVQDKMSFYIVNEDTFNLDRACCIST